MTTDIYLREARGGHDWRKPLYAAVHCLAWLFDTDLDGPEAEGLRDILDRYWKDLSPADRERLDRLAAILAEVDDEVPRRVL